MMTNKDVLWTDLNPQALPFIPRYESHSPSKQQTSEHSIGEHKASISLLTSNSKIIDKPNMKSVGKCKKPKPSNVTLDQLIGEKLKIENKGNIEKNKVKCDYKLKSVANKSKINNLLQEIPDNSLDSTAPTRKRGKESEVIKPKKPTSLKKIIIQEKNINESKNLMKEIECEVNEEPIASKLNGNESEKYDTIDSITKRILHSNSYRDYCFQAINVEINDTVIKLLTDLVNFQDRLHAKDPVKAHMKRRLCFGLREVSKYAVINKIKMLIIAPDIEKIQSKGGLDDAVANILTLASNNKTPVVFSLTRRELAITCRKKGFVSCVGVLQYDGSQENYKQLIVLREKAENEYYSTYNELKSRIEAMPSNEIKKIGLELPHISSEFCNYKTRLYSKRHFVKHKFINNKNIDCS